ncbi:MAG TPA: hypothetical protein VGA69_01565, partial [Nitriliruptorales bacterium]
PSEATGTPGTPGTPGTRGRRIPLFGEALGYLGGMLVAIAGGLLLAEHWDRLRYGAKLALVALLAVVLFSAGASLRNVLEPAAQRLVGFSWALTVGAVAWLVGLVGGRDGWALEEAPQALLVSAVAAILAAVLWAWHVRWQQHAVTFVAVTAVLVSLLSLPSHPPDPFFYGVAVAALSVVWVLLGEARLLQPPIVARWVGLLGLLAGLRVMPSEGYVGQGLVIGMVAALVLLGLGVLAELPLLLGFGSVGVFLFVPQAVFHFFGDTLGAPVALLLVGLLLIGTALLVVRARPGATREEPG